MHIGIDARLIDGQWGGVQQFVIGLASGLSNHPDKSVRYTFFMYKGHTTWLEPYISSSNCQIVTVAASPQTSSGLKSQLRKQFPFFRSLLHTIYYYSKKTPSINPLDAPIKSHNLDIFHFTFQTAQYTTLPNIYHPHDLQHRHLPELFTPYQRFVRDYLYKRFCEQASIVNVPSAWSKHDLIQEYGIPASKIVVTSYGSVLDLYPEPTSAEIIHIKKKYQLPDAFIFYPAQRWKHKNHHRLLDALSLLRQQHGLTIPLVLSGGSNDYDRVIDKYIHKLNLQDSVINIGYVNQLDLAGVYRLARMLIFPSRFEGWGLPITEALSIGLPIASSNVTNLPEQIGDAGLLFDPLDVHQMANAIHRLWIDESLREELSQKALQQSQQFTWERTAASFYAQYQQLI